MAKRLHARRPSMPKEDRACFYGRGYRGFCSEGLLRHSRKDVRQAESLDWGRGREREKGRGSEVGGNENRLHIDGRTDGEMDGRTDRRRSVCGCRTAHHGTAPSFSSDSFPGVGHQVLPCSVVLPSLGSDLVCVYLCYVAMSSLRNVSEPQPSSPQGRTCTGDTGV